MRPSKRGLGLAKATDPSTLDTLGSHRDTFDIVLERELLSTIFQIITEPRHQIILIMSYGLMGSKPHTVSELASSFRMSSARISRVLNSIHRELFHSTEFIDVLSDEWHEYLERITEETAQKASEVYQRHRDRQIPVERAKIKAAKTVSLYEKLPMKYQDIACDRALLLLDGITAEESD